MNNIYVVCENVITEYIPKPRGLKDMPFEPSIFNDFLTTDNSQMEIKKPFDCHFPLKPRFDPIMPYKEPVIYNSKPNNNIVCICKDMETAKHYLNGYPNRYILGPYNLL